MATLALLDVYLKSIEDKTKRNEIYKDFLTQEWKDVITILSSETATNDICESDELIKLSFESLGIEKTLCVESCEFVLPYLKKIYTQNKESFKNHITDNVKNYLWNDYNHTLDFFFTLCKEHIITFNIFLVENHPTLDNDSTIQYMSQENKINVIENLVLYDEEGNVEYTKLVPAFNKLFTKPLTSTITKDELNKLPTFKLVKLLKLINTSPSTESISLIVSKIIYILLQRDDILNENYNIIFSHTFKLSNIFKNSGDLQITNIFHKIPKKTVIELCSYRPARMSNQQFFYSLVNFCIEKINNFKDSCYGQIVLNYEKVANQQYYMETSEMFPHNLCENFIVITTELSKSLTYAFSSAEIKKKIRDIFTFLSHSYLTSTKMNNGELINLLNLWEFITPTSAKLILYTSGFKNLFLMPDNIANQLLTEEYIESLLTGDNCHDFIVEVSGSDKDENPFYAKILDIIISIANSNSKLDNTLDVTDVMDVTNEINIGKLLYFNKRIINKEFANAILEKSHMCCEQIYIKHIEELTKNMEKYVNVTPVYQSNEYDKITQEIATNILFPENEHKIFGICGVCYKDPIDVAFTECGHVVCDSCFGRLKSRQCPFCRSDGQKVKLFM